LSNAICFCFVLYEKIGNTFNNEKYLFKKLKEIRDASLEADPQTRIVNIWYKAGGQNSQKGDAYDSIYQKLDNKAKVFND